MGKPNVQIEHLVVVAYFLTHGSLPAGSGPVSLMKIQEATLADNVLATLTCRLALLFNSTAIGELASDIMKHHMAGEALCEPSQGAVNDLKEAMADPEYLEEVLAGLRDAGAKLEAELAQRQEKESAVVEGKVVEMFGPKKSNKETLN